MKTIGLWTDDFLDITQNVVLVRKDHYELFELAMDDNLAAKPEAVYILLPNGYEYVAYFLYYIKYAFYNDDYSVVVPANHEYVSSLFFYWESFIKAINDNDIAKYEELLHLLGTYHQGLLKKFKVILEILDDYFSLVLKPLSEGNIYTGLSESDVATWWKLTSQYNLLLNDFLKKQESRYDLSLLLLEPIIRYGTSIRKRLTHLSQASVEDAYYSFSAYCYYLAEYSMKQGKMLSSMVLIHRAVDLYLQSLGIREGIIEATNSGLKYRESIPSRELISITNTIYYLHNKGKFISDSTITDNIKWLNMKRNACLYAHGASGITSPEINSALHRCETIIRRMENAAGWIDATRNYRPNLCLNNSLIFQVEGGLDTFVIRPQ